MFLNLKKKIDICNMLHRKTIREFDNFNKKGHKKLATTHKVDLQ